MKGQDRHPLPSQLQHVYSQQYTCTVPNSKNPSIHGQLEVGEFILEGTLGQDIHCGRSYFNLQSRQFFGQSIQKLSRGYVPGGH